MDDYIETLKAFYEKKKKLNKISKKKRSKSSRNHEMIEIEKIPYYYNKEYLKNIEDKISEEKNKFLMIKYNILYNLIDEESVEEFDEIEENIRKLKEERDKVKFKIQRKEERKMKTLNDLNDRIETLKFDYKEIPEDRKINYLEIQEIRDQINDIMNNNRCIILDDSGSKIYTVITDYDPIHGNEITQDNPSINEGSNSEIERSRSGSGSNKNSKITLEVESLD